MATSTPEIPGGDLADRDRAREAWSFGLIAIILVALDGCSGGMTWLAALPLGWIAMTRARRILAKRPDGITELYARTAQITGMGAAIISGIWVLFTCVILGGYASVIVAILSEVAGQPQTPTMTTP